MKNLNKLFVIVLFNFGSAMSFNLADITKRIKNSYNDNKNIVNNIFGTAVVAGVTGAIYKYNKKVNTLVNNYVVNPLKARWSNLNNTEKYSLLALIPVMSVSGYYLSKSSKVDKKTKIALAGLAAIGAAALVKKYAQHKKKQLHKAVDINSEACWFDKFYKLTNSISDEQWLEEGFKELMEVASINPVQLKNTNNKKAYDIFKQDQKDLIDEIIKNFIAHTKHKVDYEDQDFEEFDLNNFDEL